jgi:hypothetical protein
MDAEVFPSTPLTDSLSFLIGECEMEREGVTPIWRSKEDDRPISETLLHAEHVAVEGDRSVVIGYEEVNVADADRGHEIPLKGSDCAKATGAARPRSSGRVRHDLRS